MNYFNSFINWGADKKTTSNQSKKIKLFNVFCLAWYFLAVIAFLENIIIDKKPEKGLIVLICMIFPMIITQWIHGEKNRRLGYVLYVALITILTFYFSNYLIKGEFLEYYYIFVPSVSLIFIDNKKTVYGILIVNYLLLIFPNIYFNLYDKPLLEDFSVTFLYFGVFILVNYFKNLNIRNEKNLKEKTKELEEINSFKSQFFTNVSHEIRTPITIIKGYNDELKDIEPSTKEIETVHSNISTQISKISDIVNNVLDLAKMEESKFNLHLVSSNIDSLIKKLYLSFEPLFKQKEISLKIINKTSNNIVDLDIVYFERAMGNLITNALKYTEKGEVCITTTNSENHLLIRIKDTGIGISKDDIHKVFNNFYQVNNDINKSGGSGIGLSFTKEIIKLHKGKIDITSTLGVGTTFSISLPLSTIENKIKESEQIKSAEKEPKFTPSRKNTKLHTKTTFLIVDDNVELRNYLKHILQEHKIIEANNGMEALELLKNNSVDCIITDYMMPKMDGFEFIKQVKALDFKTPIIMLTAKSDVKTKLNVLELGTDDYLNKPFEKKELLLRIKNLLKNTSERNKYVKENTIDKKELKDTFIRQLEQFVINNIENSKFSQEDIVEEFHISKSSLYRKVKSKTGLSPKEFITEIKLQKAYQITQENPEILLKQLAYQVGFNHNSYFSKLYEERFGHKPLRKNN